MVPRRAERISEATNATVLFGVLKARMVPRRLERIFSGQQKSPYCLVCKNCPNASWSRGEGGRGNKCYRVGWYLKKCPNGTSSFGEDF